MKNPQTTIRIGQRVVRRLAAAEGYLELRLPGYALAELDAIEDSGPFTAIEELLRGEALQAQARFGEAIPRLKRAAEMFPAPYGKRAWLALSICYRERGESELADEAAQAAINCNEQAGLSPHNMQVKPIFAVEMQLKVQRRSPFDDDEE